MKTYLTAEQLEEQAAKLQKRLDRFVMKANSILTKNMNELYSQLNDDQRARVLRRQRARDIEAKRPRIIHPGSARMN